MSGDTIVAARVPEEIKERGNEVLAGLGYTPTQLINSAYKYVLEFQRLPYESAAPKPGERSLSRARMKSITDELNALQVCTYDYSQGGAMTFKEALAKSILSAGEQEVPS
jgi:antitoxin component of RelBE/YafQ-DinJ toxin-antitoxin module